jgi:hypothetical protein
MLTRIFLIAFAIAFFGVMIWGILISGKRRKGNWFGLLRLDVTGFLDSIWRTRPK